MIKLISYIINLISIFYQYYSAFILRYPEHTDYKGLYFSGYMSNANDPTYLNDPENPTTQGISSEKLSWNANGIILGIGTLQVSLTFHNRLNNDRKKIDYATIRFVR